MSNKQWWIDVALTFFGLAFLLCSVAAIFSREWGLLFFDGFVGLFLFALLRERFAERAPYYPDEERESPPA